MGERRKSEDQPTRNRLVELLHKLLHNRFPEPPKTHQNRSEQPTLHNNIRKVGSFRNRQVISSSLIVGSIFSLRVPS
jgi:hypothetical protein